MTDIGVLVTLDEEALRSRAILDYTSRDFTSIRAQLVGLAQGIMPEWNTAGESSDFGTLLLELYAYMGDTLNFYIDRTASEAFLSTAIRQQSVWYIADMLGYTPTGQSAATVTLTLTAYVPDPTDPLTDIVVPAGTKVYNTTNNADQTVVFETLNTITFKPGETATVLAEEGITVKDYFLGAAFGVPNTEFLLPEKGVIAGSLRVVSAEGYESIVWSYTSDLATARPTQSTFTTYVDDMGFTHLVFGDNTSGRIPAVNAQMYATYRYGVGARANDIATDKLQTLVPQTGFFEGWQVTVTNAEQPRGGVDPESVESMKYSIPRAGARIRSRAVTLNDFADLAMQVPGVAKSVAYGTVYTSVKVWLGPTLNSSADDLSDEQMDRLCNSVERYMADKVLIGATVVCGPPKTSELWTDMYIRITVHVAEVYNRASVRDSVDQVLRKLLSYELVDFGTRVALGDLYRAVLTVQGVEWAEIRWLSTTKPPLEEAAPEALSAPVGIPIAPVQTLLTAIWKYETITTPAEPTSAHYRFNDDATSADPDFVHIKISHQDTTAPAAGSNDRTAILAQLQVGDHLVLNTVGDGASWWDYAVHSAPEPHAGTGAPLTPGFIEMDVALLRASTNNVAPSVNEDVTFTIIRYSPTPISSGDISDIDTDELHIPRINPDDVTENPANWPPNFTEEELSHDGLWVIALGGLANT